MDEKPPVYTTYRESGSDKIKIVSKRNINTTAESMAIIQEKFNRIEASRLEKEALNKDILRIKTNVALISTSGCLPTWILTGYC